jgi:hypothetical protein
MVSIGNGSLVEEAARDYMAALGEYRVTLFSEALAVVMKDCRVYASGLN